MERMNYPTYSEIKKLDKKLYNIRMEVYDRVYVLEKENKSLNEEIERLKQNIMQDELEIIPKLEKEIKKLKIEIGGLMGERDGLKMVVDKLHKEIEECECSFGFESDECGYWKREYKRLKKWIKDHCKGYGNLFPEDEMKRQWKKADKKRKKYKNMEADTLQELKEIGELDDDELIYEEGLYD